jgi:nickel/cobalt transporter (NicO) family protein
MIKNILVFCVCAATLLAHPMGNFSISHYTKLQPSAKGVELQYVLDLAEIPTFEMLRDWKMVRTAPQAEFESHAGLQARLWLKNVEVAVDGKTVQPKFESVNAVIADGAGNLPILRITTHAHIDARGGKLTYEDHNYSERAGWKEIVVEHGNGVTVSQASQTNLDISKGLTQYPADPTIAPPQDLRAEITWTVPVVAIVKPVPVAAPMIQQIVQPKVAPPAPAPATLTAKGAPAGSVTRGDYLSRFLHTRELTPWMIFLALGAAFILGSAHAFTPGHGKTIVAAYLVGSRGTLKHAAFLGAMVTLTHTIVVFALGLATLFLFNYVVPERVTEILGALSGVSIAAIGGWMLYKRLHTRTDNGHSHSHGHGHFHTHGHHGHIHSHGGHTHSHRSHSHSHVPEEMSWKGLTALGASGGLVPCESALVLLLGAIALGRVGLGLLLLVSFSLGLAIVLMAIGIAVLYAKNLIPESRRSGNHPLIRWASIASPAVVLVIGILMTAVSLGLIQPKWMIG